MRWGAQIREALSMTWAAKVPSLLIVVVVAAMCFTSLATIGRSAAAAAEVAHRLEQAGARKLTVLDAKSLGFINTRTLSTIQGMSTIEQANALGAPFDVVNGAVGPGGVRIPVWPVLGEVADVVATVRGRLPQPGEVLVSSTLLSTLNLAEPVGYLETADGLTQYPIVGSFTPTDSNADLAAGALMAATPDQPGRELRAVINSITTIRPTVAAVMAVLSPSDQQGVYVESPATLAETARDLNNQLADAGRTLLLLILAIGGLFVAAVVLTDVLVRRRDLGRRRTLGITRPDLITLVTGRAAITATIGAILGCIAGAIYNLTLDTGTPIEFTTAVGTLAVIVAALVAFAPAAFAARLDPVTVMRTP